MRALGEWLAELVGIRAWERRNGVPFFRVVKETDPDAAYYMPELRNRYD